MRRRFLVSLMLSDVGALAVALSISALFVFDTPWIWRVAPSSGESIMPLVALLGSGALAASYGVRKMWEEYSPRTSYGSGLAIVAFAGAFAASGVIVSRAYWSRSFVAVGLTIWTLLNLTHRFLRRRRPWTERMVIVTAEKQLVDDLRATAHAEILDVYHPAEESPQNLVNGETLAVDFRSVLSDRMAQFVASSDVAAQPVRSLLSVYEEHAGRLPLAHLAEGWELSTPVSRNVYAPLKRPIDTLLILITLPLWIVLTALIWITVKADSPGPGFYRQRRVGVGGSVFWLYKFRTMVDGAEPDGPRFAALSDDRLTRAGSFLRRTHLDEVPQLWNVLRGDMSLIGPRPERPEWTREYEQVIPFYAYRYLVRPGLSGWAQVQYGYADDEAAAIDKLTYDLYYVKHMSPWLDAGILGSSLWAVLSGFRPR